MAKRSRAKVVRSCAPRARSVPAAEGRKAYGGPSSALPWYWPWLFCPVLSLWLTLSKVHRQELADSLLPSLTSTMKWTPYFWRQARYGMLWPLVCSWIHHPLCNMLAVMFCNVTAGLMAHFLLARFLWRAHGPWPWTGLVSILATLALGSDRFVFETLSPLQFMTTPLAFGLAGLFVLERTAWSAPRLGCVAAAFGIVAWYNPAACVLLGALVFWAGGVPLMWPAAQSDGPPTQRAWRSWLASLATVTASLAAGAWMMRHARYHNPVFDQGLPFALWMQTARTLFLSMFTPAGDDMGAPWLAGVVGMAFVSLTALVARRRTPALTVAWTRAVAGLLAPACYGLVVSQRAWAQQEHCNARYFFPVLFVATSAVSLLAVAAVQTVWRQTAGTHWTPQHALVGVRAGSCVVALVLALTGARFGPPSYAGVERWLTAWTGEVGEELMAHGCTHVTGRYWDAWPAAFYVNWRRYEQGNTTPFFAISNWAEPTVELWPKDVASWKVGVLSASTQDAALYLHRYGVPELEVRERSAHLLVATVKRKGGNKLP